MTVAGSANAVNGAHFLSTAFMRRRPGLRRVGLTDAFRLRPAKTASDVSDQGESCRPKKHGGPPTHSALVFSSFHRLSKSVEHFHTTVIIFGRRKEGSDSAERTRP